MSRRLLTSFSRSSSGTAAIEFGFIVGPLLLLLVGTVEVGRLVWTKIALQETANAGARCMGLKTASCATSGTYSSSLTTSYVSTLARGWAVTLAASNLTLSNSTTCGGQSGFSKVTISYTFQTAAPHLLTAFLGGVALSANACFPNQS
jgi:Flp pilus assembly protein TadG